MRDSRVKPRRAKRRRSQGQRAKRAAVKRGETRRAHPVSDHALLRYLERVVGIEVEAYREAMLTPVVEVALENGAAYVKSNGYRLAIMRGRVVTVLPS